MLTNLKRIKLEINSRNLGEISKYLEIEQIFKITYSKKLHTHTYTIQNLLNVAKTMVIGKFVVLNS